MKKLMLLLFVYLFAVSSFAYGQETRSGKIGLGYNGIFQSATNDFNLTFWLSQNIVLEPKLGFKYLDIEDGDGTNIKAGVGLLAAFEEFVVVPYLGGRINGIFANTGETYSDIKLSFVFGGEYFVTDWFSAGAEIRLNYIDTDEDFSPGYGVADATIIESEQVLNLKVYFR